MCIFWSLGTIRSERKELKFARQNSRRTKGQTNISLPRPKFHRLRSVPFKARLIVLQRNDLHYSHADEKRRMNIWTLPNFPRQNHHPRETLCIFCPLIFRCSRWKCKTNSEKNERKHFHQYPWKILNLIEVNLTTCDGVYVVFPQHGTLHFRAQRALEYHPEKKKETPLICPVERTVERGDLTSIFSGDPFAKTT